MIGHCCKVAQGYHLAVFYMPSEKAAISVAALFSVRDKVDSSSYLRGHRKFNSVCGPLRELLFINEVPEKQVQPVQ